MATVRRIASGNSTPGAAHVERLAAASLGRILGASWAQSHPRLSDLDRYPQRTYPQVIPERTGSVKRASQSVFDLLRRGRVRRSRRRGQGSRVARPRSGRRALKPAPFGASFFKAEKVAGGGSPRCCVLFGRCAHRGRGVRAGGLAQGTAGHPFAATRRHDGVRGAPVGGVNQNRATTPVVVGVMTCTTRAHQPLPVATLMPPPTWCPGRGLPVAEGVEDVLQLPPGGADSADFAPAFGTDLSRPAFPGQLPLSRIGVD